MRYQDQVVKATQKALDDISRAALAVPAEHVEWVPMGDARSVLSQMREVAVSAVWFLPIVRDGEVPEFSGHAMRDSKRLQASYETVQACIDAARGSTSDLCRAILAFPDARMEEEIQLPFGTMSFADLLGLHQWNMVYHLGQINQIQLMLGDRTMH